VTAAATLGRPVVLLLSAVVGLVLGLTFYLGVVNAREGMHDRHRWGYTLLLWSFDLILEPIFELVVHAPTLTADRLFLLFTMGVFGSLVALLWLLMWRQIREHRGEPPPDILI
jgi:hypothetical protein